MCVIIYLPEGAMLPEDKLFHAIHNNEHGYGIITRKDDIEHFEVKKGMFMDPDDMLDYLEKYRLYERFIHLRYNTVGETSKDNLHPFLVYNDRNEQAWLMHNGTLQDYRGSISSAYQHGVKQHEQAESDTARFANEFLSPLLSKWKNGCDLSDEFLCKLIESKFTYTNKGLLIPNKGDPLFINAFERFSVSVTRDNETKEFDWYASNNTYFNSLTRGTLHEERKKSQQVANTTGTSTTYAGNGKALADFSRFSFKNTNDDLVRKAETIFESVDIWEDDGLANLAYLTDQELHKAIEENNLEFNALLSHVFCRFKDLYEYNRELVEEIDTAHEENRLPEGETVQDLIDRVEVAEEKHKKASKHIEKLQKQINDKEKEGEVQCH